MNDLRFELGSPTIKVDRLGKRENLTIKDDVGNNAIVFEMESGGVIDILSGILYFLTPQQMEELASKMVFECLNDETLAAFVKSIKSQQAERVQDKLTFGPRQALLFTNKSLVEV